MSRFADPTRTATLDLGECRCAGTPHERDEYVYRTELGDVEEGRAGAYGWSVSGGRWFDWAMARAFLIGDVAGVSWNLVNDEGDPVPLRTETVALLDEPTLNAMAQAIDKAQADFRGTLPNGSGAPSRGSSRASASRARKTRTRR